jgi:hypothetical protein
VREARVLHHGVGRASMLNAIGRVLHPLSGLEPELPTPAAERAVIVPAMTPTPGPAPNERRGELTRRQGRRAGRPVRRCVVLANPGFAALVSFPRRIV